jgi:hypothetical protein
LQRRHAQHSLNSRRAEIAGGYRAGVYELPAFNCKQRGRRRQLIAHGWVHLLDVTHREWNIAASGLQNSQRSLGAWAVAIHDHDQP